LTATKAPTATFEEALRSRLAFRRLKAKVLVAAHVLFVFFYLCPFAPDDSDPSPLSSFSPHFKQPMAQLYAVGALSGLVDVGKS
jgi:hypothetical protein